MVLNRDTILASPVASMGTAGAVVVTGVASRLPSMAVPLGAPDTTGREAGGGAGATGRSSRACGPVGPRPMLASTPPLSRRARLTLAISATGRVETSFQITMRWESLGRMASTASYISRALVVWPVFW